MKKIQIVDLVRSFSILAVLAFHFGLSHVTSSAGTGLLQFLWRRFWINGAYGVQIFFLVSGFLITRFIAQQKNGLFRPNFRDFYSRRVGRILPLYILILALGIIFMNLPVSSGQMAFCLKNSQASFEAPFWMSIATFTFNWHRAFFAHPVQDFGLLWDILWYLSIEVQFYLLYPLFLMWIGREKTFYQVLWFFVLLGPAVRGIGVAFFPAQFYWNMNTFAVSDLFAMGCLLYLFTFRNRGLAPLKKNKIACFIICLAGAFVVIKTFLTLPTELDFERRVFGPFFVGAGVFLFLLGGIHLEFFKSSLFEPFALPGKLTYGQYMFHPVLLYLLWPWLAAQNGALAFIIFALAVVGAAYVLNRFYETPANAWIQGFINRVAGKHKRKKGG